MSDDDSDSGASDLGFYGGEDSEGAQLLDRLEARTRGLERTANSFARAMTRAFSSSVTSGKQFDDVLKSMALRMSNMVVRLAFQPLESAIAGGFKQLFAGFGNLFGGEGGLASLFAANGAVKPFAAGGVIGAPTYFPLAQGGIGLAGEAGPEAIMPLRRGPDGRLGVATSGAGAAAAVTINIATPDVESFRRSEAYVVGQMTRAVMRGQRGL